MTSIDVMAAFDFLDKEERIGTLSYERINGDASYLFDYNPDFLKCMPGTALSRDLGLFTGLQSKRGAIFSFLSDACPDRWGKALIDKRESQYARENNRLPRVFDDFGYMVRLDDKTRMGAIRFIYKGKYIGTDFQDRAIPIVAELKTLVRESQEYEKAVKDNRTPDSTWVNNLMAQGSSLGGARPKANVIKDGVLHIAKFPSIKDTYDIALWEHFAMRLARKAGVTVPDTEAVLLPGQKYHVLLSKRFDRDGEKRIHYASSLTLTGLKDGDGAGTGKGYPDIANAIVSEMNVSDVNTNLEQLYRRIAFNIAIGNYDDHFRNHGFILTSNGWTLSPAFDLNPTNMTSQSLMISSSSNESSLGELLRESDAYLIERKSAEEIIKQVVETVSSWRQTAKAVGINVGEQQRFAKRLDLTKLL